MKLQFYKYQGTGNDFILLDGRKKSFVAPTQMQIETLCHRQFGIGADGLIIIKKSKQYDFEMLYYNADGKIGSMCGNGGRCAVSFAFYLKIINNKTSFLAYDGEHSANIKKSGIVELKMSDVSEVKSNKSHFVLNTGSPHFVQFITSNLNDFDVVNEGKKIRYSDSYKKEGINVNFAALKNNEIWVRTYERGVENETLSCGTGVTATAIAAACIANNKGKYSFKINTPGGTLQVKFATKNHHSFNQIYLSGPAKLVFTGTISL